MKTDVFNWIEKLKESVGLAAIMFGFAILIVLAWYADLEDASQILAYLSIGWLALTLTTAPKVKKYLWKISEDQSRK